MIDAFTALRLFVLALAIYREARGEPWAGKLAVAQTIENRVQDPRWPDTYPSVILQPWQFSAFNKGDPNALKFPADGEPAWKECYDAAIQVMVSPDDFARGANHYCTTALQPIWAEGHTPVLVIGKHQFFKL